MTSNDPIIDRAREVADALQGTAGYLGEHATDAEINDARFCDELDSLVFECARCGWWCESGEAEHSNQGDVCGDCFDGCTDCGDDR